MAEILIKNMKMPKDMSNPLHISIFSNGSVWITHEGKTEATAQELLPHGRLIDADVLIDKVLDGGQPRYDSMVKMIQNAPTVIEASKERE